MNKVRHYFRSQAEVLKKEFVASSIVDRSVIGEDREVLLKDFLEKHLAGDSKIGMRGQIIDSNGLSSQETDIVIYRPFGPRFGDLNFYLAENVLATIEVKSTLNRRKLLQALKGVSKIKRLVRDYNVGEAALPPIIPCGIFAFGSGMKVQDIRLEIARYYSSNVGVEKVNWICVLGSFFIKKS